MAHRHGVFAVVALVLALGCGGGSPPPSPGAPPTAPTPTPTPPPPPAQPITDILGFLDTCPAADPAYAQIRQDLTIRRNGVPVNDIPCVPPASAQSSYTDELIVLQGFRLMYHMDAGLGGHLPWTPLRLYPWFVSQVAGVNIDDTATYNGCCQTFDGKPYIVLIHQDDFNRDFDRTWDGLSGNVLLYAHEARHRAGFGHTSCCGISGGCDQTYDEANLSTYGVQYWLARAWARGDINVGLGCLGGSARRDAVSWQMLMANSYLERFCDTRPPRVSYPPEAGGACRM
jgi:hypothetical protein